MLWKINLLLLLLSSSLAFADEANFMQSGAIQADSEQAGIVLISGKQYRVDNSTIVHGLVIGGEVGPKFQTGDVIGFNTESTDGNNVPYITEAWLLNE